MSHLKRIVRIDAPLETVYHTVHDPKHWDDWYVGVSDEVEMEADEVMVPCASCFRRLKSGHQETTTRPGGHLRAAWG